MISLLMNVGTFLSVLASLPSMIIVLRNRDCLRGHSVSGHLMRLAAILCFTAAQVMLKVWLSVAFNVLSLAYSAVVLFYMWRYRG